MFVSSLAVVQALTVLVICVTVLLAGLLWKLYRNNVALLALN